MAARLGNVIYWFFCIVAVLFLALSALVAFDPGINGAFWAVAYIVFAVIAFTIGRAARYVLAGK